MEQRQPRPDHAVVAIELQLITIAGDAGHRDAADVKLGDNADCHVVHATAEPEGVNSGGGGHDGGGISPHSTPSSTSPLSGLLSRSMLLCST
jgi:hypothetical protein